MGRGLGDVQRAILAALASDSSDEPWTVRELIEALYQSYPPSEGGWAANALGMVIDRYYSASTSVNRALRALADRGLVECAGRLRHDQGRPNGWKITDAGKAIADKEKPPDDSGG